jgi:hypothetical protein
MKYAHAALLLVALMFSSCQGPKVQVVLDQLKPGMLKGKTVGVEGMMITADSWPGTFIDTPILFEAEKVLKHRLKGVQVCLIDEAGVMHEDEAQQQAGGQRHEMAAGGSSARAKQPDYVFKIMLTTDSVTSKSSSWGSGGVQTGRMIDRRSPGFNAFGGWAGFNDYNQGAGYYRGGMPYNMVGRSGSFAYAVREHTTRVLKADYTLSDYRTCKILWKAEAVASRLYVSLDAYVPSYITWDAAESKVPLKPLWISMNTAAVRTIKKSHL